VSRNRVIALASLGAIVALSLILTPGFTAGFLTKSKAKALFFTKSQSDSRYLTQAQADSRYLTPSQGDGRYLTPSQGDGRYLPVTGQIRLNANPMSWVTTANVSGIPVGHESGATDLGPTAATATVNASIAPTMPTELMGKPLTLVGVNACYTNIQTTLTAVKVNTTTNTAGNPSSSLLVTDGTARTDDACRNYTPSTPHAVGQNEDISLEFDVSFPGTPSSLFAAGRATFIFQL
jgi:hypothetical protein